MPVIKIQEFWRQVRVKWSLWRFLVPACLNVFSSAICYSVGWHMSTAESSMPLARAGALATAIAIAFTLYSFNEKITESERAACERIARFTRALPMTGADSQSRILEQLKQQTRLAVRSERIAQATILILATVIWGFGDLAALWI